MVDFFLQPPFSIDTYQRSLIVKRQLPNLARRQLFRADRAFANEIIAYTKVMPQFHRFADSIDLPIPFVNCLFAGNDDAGDLIVVDDLKPFGFRMANRLKGLDYTHCKIALQVCIFFWAHLMLFKLSFEKISPNSECEMGYLGLWCWQLSFRPR